MIGYLHDPSGASDKLPTVYHTWCNTSTPDTEINMFYFSSCTEMQGPQSKFLQSVIRILKLGTHNYIKQGAQDSDMLHYHPCRNEYCSDEECDHECIHHGSRLGKVMTNWDELINLTKEACSPSQTLSAGKCDVTVMLII